MKQNDPQSRISELEQKITHLDKFIEDLNDIVIKQWQNIKQFENQLAHIRDRLLAIETREGSKDPKDGTPPHY